MKKAKIEVIIFNIIGCILKISTALIGNIMFSSDYVSSRNLITELFRVLGSFFELFIIWTLIDLFFNYINSKIINRKEMIISLKKETAVSIIITSIIMTIGLIWTLFTKSI